ncbi:serine hydrolase domain-containing protein [Streptomyces edwardsiae]|uniref:Serine hydrolase domain-containing protein n=1 Tax=Streptomyces edwardsiae TaxID=3075527 RepID=A0ABU2PV41_9ACTN|nr:serine hydrolase domain-containing protein [Streptomyces sp. DSM 41636]MDT0396036.1 serine hydrolase domain-containing protein [Streptomyces sp. DSM 41636]
MHARRRTTLLAASVVLALGAGPLAAPAFAAPAPRAPVCTTAPSHQALCAAIGGLPDASTTAALVRMTDNGVAWQGSSGVRDLRSGKAADPDARFRAGSTTKVVTAAAVLRLAARGDVDLDASIERYLPGLLGPEFEQPVTVRNLLNHTSGIQPGVSWGNTFEEQYAHRYDTLSPRRVVESAVARGPAFDAGDQQQYLNINYTILGLLIEKVTGRPYASEADRLVLRPAGMRDTYFPGTDPRVRGPHHHGYQRVERPDGTTRLVDVTEWNVADRWAAGDMISTTADLERLITALFSGEIVPEPQLREMFTVPAGIEGAAHSAGLTRLELRGTVYWGKSGARPGYSTLIAATEDLGFTLVFSLSDTDAKDQSSNPVADRIREAALT